MTDIDQLEIQDFRVKAAAERDKRLHEVGVASYERLDGWSDDPFTPKVERDPVHDHVEFVFIGGGFSGLTAGARAKEAGLSRVRLIDSAGDFGGVWYWNRYPGAMCDTASLVYLPLLEETGYMPTEKYAHGPEIFEHARRIARHYQLYDDALLHTTVTGAEWDDEHSVWRISTNRGDHFTTKYLAMGVGPLSIPRVPGIPGAESFAGHSFHTSRWDFDYTGENLERLAGKRVAVIGTGATAIQLVPELQKADAEVYVVQRTPTGVDARKNGPIDAEWFSSIATDGWQQRWYDNFAQCHLPPMTPEFSVEMDDYVQDGWTEIGREWRAAMAQIPPAEFSPQTVGAALNQANYTHMRGTHARVDELVKDPLTAAKLKPWYKLFCKRPGFHDEYLQSFNEANVHLVDTDGRGVDRIAEHGVVVNAVEYEVDCIVYASGFEAFTPLEDRLGFELWGRDGVKLSEAWQDGMKTLHGVFTRGFPNLFIVQGVHGAMFAACVTMDSALTGRKIGKVIEETEQRDARTVEVSQQAQDAWMELLHLNPGGGGPLFDDECTPGYYNNEGAEVTLTDKLNATGYPFGSVAYFEMDRAWLASGQFDGLIFER